MPSKIRLPSFCFQHLSKSNALREPELRSLTFLRLLASSPDFTSAETLSKVIIPELEACTSDTYIIVSQPGANALDYRDRASPYLQMKMLGNDKSIRSSLAVREVVGELSAGHLSGVIQEKCGAGHLRVDASSKSSCRCGDAVESSG